MIYSRHCLIEYLFWSIDIDSTQYMFLKDLKLRRGALLVQQTALYKEIAAIDLVIALHESKFNIGERVVRWGVKYEISRISSCCEKPKYHGRRILKSGSLGNKEFDYPFDRSYLQYQPLTC